ncbi:MAG TPA: hypothetical protein VN238_13420 [Solirubrobacteraceae bacterium]|nr:hypothetical protein [Solirubrobacteraceae bacterium]
MGSCSAAVLGGTVSTRSTSGSTGVITSTAFSGCTWFGARASLVGDVTPSWAWTLDGWTGAGSITGVDMLVAFGGTSCRYVGTLSFVHTQATGGATISGTLTKSSGPLPCPTSLPVTASGLVY